MTKYNNKTRLRCHEPFAIYAEKYLDIGCSVFPVEGKKAVVSWKSLQRKRPSNRTFENWQRKFPSSNIGIVTGKVSGITVIDCDDPNVSVSELFDIYGETNFVVRTPSGGHHLYYKFNGENSRTGLDSNIDLKGEGGYVVAAGSYNPESGQRYYIISGDMYDLMNLPYMKKQFLNLPSNKGERNNKLFYYLKDIAVNIDSLENLIECALKYNIENLFPELDLNEVKRTSKSVWKYKENGTLFNSGKQCVIVNMCDKIKNLMKVYPAAFTLLFDLISMHNIKNAIFAVSPKGYAERLHWSKDTIKNARDKLLEDGLIICIHKGGKGCKDPSLYKFAL
jgi:hypothetical protein